MLKQPTVPDELVSRPIQTEKRSWRKVWEKIGSNFTLLLLLFLGSRLMVSPLLDGADQL